MNKIIMVIISDVLSLLGLILIGAAISRISLTAMLIFWGIVLLVTGAGVSKLIPKGGDKK